MFPMDNPTTPLTHRQRAVLEYIRDFTERNGYPPSLRDICIHFGIKGPKNARKHIDALEKKGFLRRTPGVSRGIGLISPSKGVVVPVAGRVRAGTPELAIEDIEGYVTLDEGFFNCRGCFLLRVEGESMEDAGIEEGDHILVRPQRDALNGDIVVAMVDDEATVKRFYRYSSTVVLKPENPHMKPIWIDTSRGHPHLTIVGKVVSIIKKRH